MSEAKKPTCTFTGRVVEIGHTQKLGKDETRPFYKRTIKVDDAEEGAKYHNPVTFEITGDKCNWLDKFAVGQNVEIDFFPRGRDWKDPKTGKVLNFVSLNIGYIKDASAGDTFAGAVAEPQTADAQGIGEGDDGDYPF